MTPVQQPAARLPYKSYNVDTQGAKLGKGAKSILFYHNFDGDTFVFLYHYFNQQFQIWRRINIIFLGIGLDVLMNE